jgi:hypothetical protein
VAEHSSHVWLAVKRALLLTFIAALVLATPASAATHNHFGRMFDNLPGFTTPTTQDILDLSLADKDPVTSPDNLKEPAGMTYLGQFADHDLTLDLVPQPTTQIDPTTIPNNRTFMFDLDSVFGQGPVNDPALYAADHRHLCIQAVNPNGVPDLCRNATGAAIIPDGRNDENEIIGQIQVAFIQFYNRLIDQGKTPGAARKTERHYWQWIVLHQLLPTFVGQSVVNDYLRPLGNSRYSLRTPLYPKDTYTPVEFAVAAYRLHTIVRPSYAINDNPDGSANRVDVFNASGNDLHGGRQLPADHLIEWGNFLPPLAEQPPIVNGVPSDDFNFGRPFDHLISPSLYNLPIPGAEPSGSNNLPFRNITRGVFYSLPSGQAVAKAMGLTPIPADTINPTSDAVFDTATPLWQYINAEAAIKEGGARLGPVGAAIDAQTFLRVLASTPNSIVHVDTGSRVTISFRPSKRFIAPCDNGFTFTSFVVFAGAADCPS